MRAAFLAIFLVLFAAASAQAQALSDDAAAHACAAAKLKAVAKNSASKLKCEAAAIAKKEMLDSACTSKADAKLQSAIDKAASKGGCNTGVDASNLQPKVDSFLYDMVAAQRVFPTCDNPGGACGHCGDGICAQHGTDDVCISNGTFDTPGCASDAQCISTPDQLCATNPNTSSSACVSACP